MENSVEELEITEKLNLLDGRGSSDEYDAVKDLSSLGDRFPELLFQKYQNSKKWGERVSCVYHAIKYAQTNNSAFQLGLLATKDKSKNVRYRACMLLAIAQNPSAIKYLETLLTDTDSSEDAKAAIDAIKHKNHHYFADRDHSGMVKLNV